jgi:hypothetical protein
LDQVKAWLGLEASDVYDDVVLAESLAAAVAAQAMVVAYPVDEDDQPVMVGDLREAVLLRTQRLAARRNSPEGVVGLSGIGGDFISARVPAGDSDVLRLEGPWLVIPVA